jgi:hypothetical protein
MRPLRLFQTTVCVWLTFVICWVSELQAAQSVTLAWDPNPDPAIAGYRLYSGTSSRIYTQQLEVGNTTTTLVSNLADGRTYFFAVTAYSTAGAESIPSNEVSYTAPGSAAASQAMSSAPASMPTKAAPAPTRIKKTKATSRRKRVNARQPGQGPHGGSVEAAAYAQWCNGLPLSEATPSPPPNAPPGN